MRQDLGQLLVIQKSGEEAFKFEAENLDFNLLSFWKWSLSDLVSNASRGVLAEFIVAQAVGIDVDSVRNEWDAYDLKTHDGIKIEVKSAGYIQSWHQEKLSAISFSVRKKRVWNAATKQRELDPTRPAHVYVFALLAHKDKKTIDPLNLNQWEFYILPTETLNQRERSQHSITLSSLKKLHCGPFRYSQIKEVVRDAFLENFRLAGKEISKESM